MSKTKVTPATIYGSKLVNLNLNQLNELIEIEKTNGHQFNLSYFVRCAIAQQVSLMKNK